MNFRVYLITLFAISWFCNAQDNSKIESKSTENKAIAFKKSVNAIFTSEKIVIDGITDESIWKSAEIASDFFSFEPDNGNPIALSKKTNVKIAYDNEALYVSAVMLDDEPSKIMKEITQRDNDGASDFFGISINGYNDGQQDFGFYVTAAGVQLDCNASDQTGEDFSWDAIWNSAVKITDFGWVVEMKIPYAALRFPKAIEQKWGVNFTRQIRRERQMYTWTNIDNKIGNFILQSGELKGIKNIQTPTRLFFFPYASAYANKNAKGTKGTFKIGLDIKYGINDAFTLDAILIPDFGQAAFDNQILNLGPFEQQFNENRPFFTEGTDLFNKGNLFYSRRIGGSPSTYPKTTGKEEVVEYPSVVNLLNAVKISGRTKGGLGVGFLNAITDKTNAVIFDKTTGIRREVVVEPLANYNIISLDQRFNKNSSISFINTNVTRNSQFRDANVSALVFDLNTKKNTFNVSGDFKYSLVNEFQNQENRNGYNTSLNIGKTSGKLRYSMGGNYVSKEFDNNDLGINFLTNFHSLYANINYRILKPSETFNTFRINGNVYTEFENRTGKIQDGNIRINVNSTSKDNDFVGFGVNIRPFQIHDFYEARVENKFVTYPQNYGGYIYYSSNFNYKFAIDLNPSIESTPEKNRYNYGMSLGPRYRFSDKVSVNLNYNYFKQNGNKGWIAFSGDDIIFAQRNINTSTVSLNGKYALNSDMTINLTTRYYWSYAENTNFQKLLDNGNLQNTDFNKPKNSSFNSWNVDCSFAWWIFSGTQLNVLYRNNAANRQQNVQEFDKNLNNNIQNLLDDTLTHSFSISLRYFLDYNSIKKLI